MSGEFWKGRRVLLTGHTGFKGGWLSVWLQELGAEVTGFALAPPTEPNIFEAANVADGMASIEGDIRDLDALTRAYDACRPEIVMHLAAQSLVHHSYENPLETYSTNVLGTAHLLEAARRSTEVRAVLVVTSDKCYENREWLWGYRENEPLGGHDPYSSSKACTELVAAAYQRSFFPRERYEEHGIATATARAGNVIGGGDWAKDRLIPDIVRAISRGEPVKIRRPDATRPWQHVLEPLQGYLMLAERLYLDGPEFSGAWNFGPDEIDARPVSWICDRVVERWGHGASWEGDAAEYPPEAGVLKLDCAKARALLGWSPRLDLGTALDWLVEWYQAHQPERKMRELTTSQIIRYLELTE